MSINNHSSSGNIHDHFPDQFHLLYGDRQRLILCVSKRSEQLLQRDDASGLSRRQSIMLYLPTGDDHPFHHYNFSSILDRSSTADPSLYSLEELDT